VQIKALNITPDIRAMKEDAEKRHQEVLDMIETLSDSTSSEAASTV
jgi:DnaJ-class molecular chaperone